MIATRIQSRLKRALRFRLLVVLFALTMLPTWTSLFCGEGSAAPVTLAWDIESAADLAGYKLHYGTVSKSYSFTADAGKQSTYTVTGLSEGATYYFAATAYTAAGIESAPSNEVSYTVPASCSYTITPASVSYTASGGTGSVSVTAPATCTWTASNSASWVSITGGGSRTGNGTVSYSVAANTASSSRIAGLTIAGSTFTVTQAGAGTSTYTITVSAGSNGTISPSGQVPVASGTSKTFTITPSAGYQVSDVKVDGVSVGKGTSYTFTNVTANHAISASFTAGTSTTYTLTVTKAGTGSGTVTANPSGTGFAAGTPVTLTATPRWGSMFSGWSGACSGTSRTCALTMSSAKSVTASFRRLWGY
jgi:hypothetical protein